MSTKRETPLPALRFGGDGRQNALRLDAILPRLQGVRQLPSGEWVALCPSHADSNPSLSLRELPDGTLLWHCHAGCSQEAVGEALRKLAGVDAPQRRRSAPRTGLTLEQYARAKRFDVARLREWYLYDDSYPKDGRPCVRIEYRNEQGEVACIQYRLRLEGDPRFVWREGDSGAIYGLWRVPEFSGHAVWLLEGSSDCHTLWHLGAAALALPSASAKRELLEQAWGILARFEQVYVCFDSDRAGQELLQRLSDACPSADLRERVKVVPLPQRCKDINDLRLACNGDAESFKSRLLECLERAEPLPEPQAGEPPAQADRREEPIRVVRFSEIQETDLPALVPDFLYEGAVTILAGLPASGKTTLALELACAIVEGGEVWGSVQVSQGAVVWAPYDHPPKQLRLIANQYYGEAPRDALYFVDGEFQEPLCAETYHRWRELLQAIQPRLFVADTLYHLLDVSDELRDLEARQGMRLLRNLAEETGCAVLALHHPRKANPEQPATYALSGNLRWAAAADVLAFLHLIRREGYGEGQLARLSIVKNRHGNCPVSIEFERVARRFIPVNPSEMPSTELQVIRRHLESAGEATYDELLEALRRAGFLIGREALRHRIRRWADKGILIHHQRGFPRQTYISLAQVQVVLPKAPVRSDSLSSRCDARNERSERTGGVRSVQIVHSAQGVFTTHALACAESAPPSGDGDFEALLQAWVSDPHFPLEPEEAQAARLLWQEAQARNYPALRLNRYAFEFPVGCAGWLGAIPKILGTPAVECALALLRGEPEPPAESPQQPAIQAPPVSDPDLLHIVEYRNAKGEPHLAPLLAQLWELAAAQGWPSVEYKQAHRLIATKSAYIACLKHQPEADLRLLLEALQQVSSDGAISPAPSATQPSRPAESDGARPIGQTAN